MSTPTDPPSRRTDAVAQAYGSLVDRYVESYGDTSAVHPEDLALIERHLAGATGLVLDLGCGPGHLTGHLAGRGADAVGLDLTPAFVEHARTTHADTAFAVGSARDLPMCDRAVGGILGWYSLIHLAPEEIDAVLAECARVSAPGAPFVVGFFDGDRMEPFDHRVVEAYRWPPDELADRLARAGFVEVERARRGPDPTTGARPHAALVVRRIAADSVLT